MEARFGYDFSGVRVHTDSGAVESSRAIDAHAYTVGQDIVFGAGKYSPGSTEGRKLIAHELTHVVQQPEVASTGKELNISNPSDESEQEAEQVAARIVSSNNIASGEPVGTNESGDSLAADTAPAPTVSRQSDDDNQQNGSSSDGGGVTEAFSSILDLGSSIASAFGDKDLGNTLAAGSKGLDAGEAADKGNVLGTVGPILDVAGGVASDIPGLEGIGALAKGASSGMDVGEAFGKGDTFEEAKSVTSAVSSLAEVGGFGLDTVTGAGVTVGNTALEALPAAAGAGDLGALGLAGPAAAVLGAGFAGAELGGGMASLADSSYTKTGAFGTNSDTGQNRSAMDWGASWGTDWDKVHGNTGPSVMGGILAGAGGIAGGIGGAIYGALNWLGQQNDDHN